MTQAYKNGRTPSGQVFGRPKRPTGPRPGEFISGIPSIRIRAPRLSMREIASDDFDLTRCLATRGSRLVCRALDRVEQREIALKIEPKDTAHCTEGPTPLEREAMIGQFLPDHENVVQLYDLRYPYTIDGRPLAALSMELAEGGSLRDWLHRARSCDDEVPADGLSYFRSLCFGVSALHAGGILHLDLKPEHALLNGGMVKICDFDLAVVSGGRSGGCAHQNVPQPPPRASTMQYMAPECFTAQSALDLAETADIYSLGIILFEILHPHHRQPFTGSYRQVCRLHQCSRLPVIPGLTSAESDVLAGCTVKNPDERFSTVDELIDAVDAVFGRDTCFGDGNGHVPTSRRDTAGLSMPGCSTEPPDESASHRMDSAVALWEEVKRDIDSGDLLELLSLAADAAELCPDHPTGQAVCARLAYRAKVFNTNIDGYQRAVEAGEIEQALAFARRAAHVYPGSVEVVGLVGRLEGRIGDIERRKTEMREAARNGDLDCAMRIAKELDDEGIPG